MKKTLYHLAIMATLLTATPVMAAETSKSQAPTFISAHEHWKVFSFMEGKQKVCFMSSQPQTQKGEFKKRGEVFFFVTRWSAERDKNVVSVASGYSFRPDAQLSVKIDDKTFMLFTQGEMAWTKDGTMDDQIAEALQKGSEMVIKGSSSRGTATTDTYDLKGTAAAYKALADACAK